MWGYARRLGARRPRGHRGEQRSGGAGGAGGDHAGRGFVHAPSERRSDVDSVLRAGPGEHTRHGNGDDSAEASHRRRIRVGLSPRWRWRSTACRRAIRHAVGTGAPPGMSRSGSAIRRHVRRHPERAARRPGVRGDAQQQSWHRRTAAIGRTRDHRPGRHEADDAGVYFTMAVTVGTTYRLALSGTRRHHHRCR